jgi:NDP-sugar pyrophosphorylase family protein
MKSRWVVGGGAYLDQAVSAWKQARPEENVIRVEVPQREDYSFDLTVLDGISPAEGSMFIAFDERFGNFKRMELMQAAMERGFKLEALISPSAIIAKDVAVGINVFVADGVIIGAGSRIDYNCVLQPGVKAGNDVRIKSSCWLDIGVNVGHGAEIGAHGILRMGAMVASGVKIGRHCELGWPRLYDKDVPPRTVFDTRYEEPIRVYGD